MNVRDEEFVVRLLRRLPQLRPGRQGRTGCPDDEELAGYLEGAITDAQRSKLENHLASCRFCLNELRAAQSAAEPTPIEPVPTKVLARAMALVPRPTPIGEIFKLVVELTHESLALISTSGRLAMPALAAQIRGKEKMADASVLHVESELGQFQVAVEVERLDGDLCQVAVNVKSSTGSVADGLRLSLMSGEREQASFLARQGSAVFDRVPAGEYRLTVTEAGSYLGVIELTIKESGHERERKTD